MCLLANVQGTGKQRPHHAGRRGWVFGRTAEQAPAACGAAAKRHGRLQVAPDSLLLGQHERGACAAKRCSQGDRERDGQIRIHGYRM